MSDHKAGLAAAVKRAAHVAARDFRDSNPGAAHLRVKSDIAVYKPRSKEMRDVAQKAVALFLNEPEVLKLSNAALAQRLGKLIGERVPQNILTEPFSPKQLIQVREHLALFRRDVDLETNNTPSKVKLALKSYGKAEKADLTYTAVITFSDDTVTVGDRSYLIQRGGGTPRIHVGTKKMNVEALKALLSGNH